MAPDDEKDIHPLTDVFASDRDNNVQIFIALVIGIFSVLIIFTVEDIERYSFAWFALTATYWGLVVVGVIAYLNWLVFILITDSTIRSYDKKYDEEIARRIENPYLKKWYRMMIYDPEHKRLGWQLWAWLVLMIVIAGSLWVTISFDLTDSIFLNI